MTSHVIEFRQETLNSGGPSCVGVDVETEGDAHDGDTNDGDAIGINDENGDTSHVNFVMKCGSNGFISSPNPTQSLLQFLL